MQVILTPSESISSQQKNPQSEYDICAILPPRFYASYHGSFHSYDIPVYLTVIQVLKVSEMIRAVRKKAKSVLVMVERDDVKGVMVFAKKTID